MTQYNVKQGVGAAHKNIFQEVVDQLVIGIILDSHVFPFAFFAPT
jgi:hypothetical protein